MLSTIGLLAGLGIFLVALFDLLLSSDQKRAFDTLTTNLWNEVDEVRKLSFADRITDPNVSRTAVALCGLLLAPVFYLLIQASDALPAVVAVSSFLFAVWVGPYVLDWARKSNGRLLGLIGVCLIVIFGEMSSGSLLASAGLFMTFYYLLARLIYSVFLVVCAACASSAEFILRRVAEYPKGAVAALGVILTAISLLAKSLSN